MLTKKIINEIEKEEKELLEIFNDESFKLLTIEEKMEIIDKLHAIYNIKFAYRRYDAATVNSNSQK